LTFVGDTAFPLPAANPFSTRFVRPDLAQYRFGGPEDDSRALADLADQVSRHLATAIVGPHGTGKTTLLHNLVPLLVSRFSAIRRIRMTSSTARVSVGTALAMLAPVFTPDPSAAIECDEIGGTAANRIRLVIIDGFEQLALPARLAPVLRLRCQIVRDRFYSGDQESQVHLLVTAHRRPVGFRLIRQTRWDEETVRTLTTEKIANLPPQQRETMLRIADDLAKITLKSAGPKANVRDYWFGLYDAYEKLCRQGSAGLENRSRAVPLGDHHDHVTRRPKTEDR
jgi:hypothetical protein